MCYMNSVLQVLIFCIPFYDFLDQVSKKAAYSFKSETPLVDAMVNFMGEYKVIDSAVSVDQLRRRLKNEELEQYGEPFTPEFVYEAIRKLPRFASMRRGHQQDAEEFLGFLLEALHDECAHVMRHVSDSSTTTAVNSSNATPAPSSPTSATDSSDWLEVGRKQRAAVTRSSGHPVASSPITKIFGGQLRSELRVSGLKDSVTLEPFQPLQLDIGAPQIRNIVDALKGLTKPETLNGDFGSPRGKDAVATKQVFLESLPPVLILHLKRFQFDAEGTGTVKIWKKIGYPLELELPKEIFSRQKRNNFVTEGSGFPKYKLIAAVYHHGKNASGGHYTVDLRRQDGREWIRLDDTVIRRVRSDDVAEGGVEEDPKAVPTPEHKKDTAASSSGNRFEGIGEDETGDGDGWNEVSAPVNGAKKWSSVVNGAANAGIPKGKPARDNIKDNKVAYLLFYQRV
ncbi:putative ubiquitin c-terminal hydrolase protein [Eutypa lata UCREL1]|uniref:ubiquitinyl hydrolase 1 n=1 Tax=Eutypa lata (strain UCR-EL1) TaxID=1287681 RepID=M7SB38_EUTLA|nr:putative ubiquitin c-terminal hydrolase protein [Eutypa lata UCREL1]